MPKWRMLILSPNFLVELQYKKQINIQKNCFLFKSKAAIIVDKSKDFKARASPQLILIPIYSVGIKSTTNATS